MLPRGPRLPDLLCGTTLGRMDHDVELDAIIEMIEAAGRVERRAR
jgi:hypothetical protein